MAVALGLSAVILFGVLFKLRTRDGTLVVEINDPDATVQVLNEEGKVLVERKGEKGAIEISVAPGKGRLRLEKNGLELFAQEFSLASGGKEYIKAWLEATSEPGNRTPLPCLPRGRGPGVRALQISDLQSLIPNPQSPIPSPADAFWQPGPAENVLPGLVARPAKLPGIGRWQLEKPGPLCAGRDGAPMASGWLPWSRTRLPCNCGRPMAILQRHSKAMRAMLRPSLGAPRAAGWHRRPKTAPCASGSPKAGRCWSSRPNPKRI